MFNDRKTKTEAIDDIAHQVDRLLPEVSAAARQQLKKAAESHLRPEGWSDFFVSAASLKEAMRVVRQKAAEAREKLDEAAFSFGPDNGPADVPVTITFEDVEPTEDQLLLQAFIDFLNQRDLRLINPEENFSVLKARLPSVATIGQGEWLTRALGLARKITAEKALPHLPSGTGTPKSAI